jgi:tRNA nucleotidyltransferase/poly(A) polymerase
MNKDQLIIILKSVLPALKNVEQCGGKAYLVGGVVRDLVMNEVINDIDIEVHGLQPEQLEAALKTVGPLFYVGKQFGVYKIASVDIDWSLPRVDSSGRRPTVAIDPFLGIENACRRRDVTMNAMALLLSSSIEQEFGLHLMQIVDPFQGVDAIRKKEIRLIDPVLFVEDPLRFYRVMHFASRFNFEPDQQLTACAKTLSLQDVITETAISLERIQAELKKMIIKGKVPSKGLKWVSSLGRLQELFPEWKVWNKSSESQFLDAMNDLDYAATLPHGEKNAKIIKKVELAINVDRYYSFMLSLLTSHLIVPEEWNNHLELKKQVPLLFRQFSLQKSIFAEIRLLLQGAALFKELKEAAQKNQSYYLKKIAALIDPAWSLKDLFVFMQVLFFRKEKEAHQFQSWVEQAEKVGVLWTSEKPVLTGADFLSEGLLGSAVGDALAAAYELQILEGISDPALLKKRVMEQLFLQNKK